jgi:hypothetical protein
MFSVSLLRSPAAIKVPELKAWLTLLWVNVFTLSDAVPVVEGNNGLFIMSRLVMCKAWLQAVKPRLPSRRSLSQAKPY